MHWKPWRADAVDSKAIIAFAGTLQHARRRAGLHAIAITPLGWEWRTMTTTTRFVARIYVAICNQSLSA